MSVIKQMIGAAGGGSWVDWEGAWLTGTEYSRNQQVGNNGDLFLCSVGHTSGATTEPGIGANWQTVWVRMLDSLTADQIAAAAGTGAPSGSNKYVTSDDNRLDTSIITGTAGEALSLHNLVYLKQSDGKYYKADNTAEASSIVIGIVVEANGILQNASGNIQVKPKFITDNSWSWTYGDVLYCGTAGALTKTWSTYAKPVGIAISAHQILYTGMTQYSPATFSIDLNPDLLTSNYTAVNYTPTVSPGVTSLTTEIGSHLHGIDLAIASIISRLGAHNI